MGWAVNGRVAVIDLDRTVAALGPPEAPPLLDPALNPFLELIHLLLAYQQYVGAVLESSPTYAIGGQWCWPMKAAEERWARAIDRHLTRLQVAALHVGGRAGLPDSAVSAAVDPILVVLYRLAGCLNCTPRPRWEPTTDKEADAPPVEVVQYRQQLQTFAEVCSEADRARVALAKFGINVDGRLGRQAARTHPATTADDDEAFTDQVLVALLELGAVTEETGRKQKDVVKHLEYDSEDVLKKLWVDLRKHVLIDCISKGPASTSFLTEGGRERAESVLRSRSVPT